jgi:glycosyl transferase, family 25
MKYKAIVINLETSSERREKIVRQLKEIQLDYAVVKAIDGKKISLPHPEIDNDFAQKNGYWIPNGLFACSLSHLKAYKLVVEEQLDFALILEDDTKLNARIPAFLQYLENNFYATGKHTFDLMLLYYASWERCTLARTGYVFEDYLIVKPENQKQLITANAYVVTAELCKRMIAFQTPLKATSDSWYAYLENDIIKEVYGVYPFLAEAADAKSDIDYVRNKYLNSILKGVNQLKIPFLYDWMTMRRKEQRYKMINFELV